MLDRRTLLLTSAAAALAGCAVVPTPGPAPDAAPPLPGPGAAAATPRDAELDALLTTWFDEDLLEAPEFATNLGLDTGARAALRGQLSEQSLAAAARNRAMTVIRATRLGRFGREGLSAEGLLNYDIAEFRLSVDAEGARFRYGEICLLYTSPSPRDS